MRYNLPTLFAFLTLFVVAFGLYAVGRQNGFREGKSAAARAAIPTVDGGTFFVRPGDTLTITFNFGTHFGTAHLVVGSASPNMDELSAIDLESSSSVDAIECALRDCIFVGDIDAPTRE